MSGEKQKNHAYNQNKHRQIPKGWPDRMNGTERSLKNEQQYSECDTFRTEKNGRKAGGGSFVESE